MNECAHIQALLSELADATSPSDALAREVREHCARCHECAAFARGLEVLASALPPDPGPALTERLTAQVMRAVRAEAVPTEVSVSPDSQAAAFDAAEDAGARVAPLGESTVSRRTTASSPRQSRLRGRSAWNVAAWAGAAAAVLVIAGFAAVAGVRSMLTPGAGSRQLATSSQDARTTDSYGDGLASPESAADSAATGAAKAATAPAAASSPGFISLGGSAYRALGASDIDRSTLTTAGSTVTSLDTGEGAKSFVAYATTTPGRVALLAPDGTRVFELVTRELGGKTFVLTAESITDFAEWPGLPSSFTPPTTADGAPTFVPGGTDDLGVAVYVRPGTRATDGFAIAPGSSATDPALGNPNWTWWALPR